MLPLLLITSIAGATDLQFGYPTHLEGGDRPGLFITPPRSVSVLDVECTQGDQVFHWNESGLPGGATKKFLWDRDPDNASAECVIQVRFTDDTAEGIVLNLDFTYGASLSVDLGRASVDLEAHTLSIEATAPVQKAEIVAYGAGKVVLDQREVAVSGGPGMVDIPWVGDPAEVVILEVKLFAGSSWAGFTYSPWFLDVPHEDVIFETNSDVVSADQEYKLERTLRELEDVVEKYGDLVPVKLYIAGCTDTVGDQASNMDLSRRRARAIARWLNRKGFTYAIYYHGFGEKLLAVQTDDEVDESRNRRALYLVSSNPPPAGSGIPSAGWTKL